MQMHIFHLQWICSVKQILFIFGLTFASAEKAEKRLSDSSHITVSKIINAKQYMLAPQQYVWNMKQVHNLLVTQYMGCVYFLVCTWLLPIEWTYNQKGKTDENIFIVNFMQDILYIKNKLH